MLTVTRCLADCSLYRIEKSIAIEQSDAPL